MNEQPYDNTDHMIGLLCDLDRAANALHRITAAQSTDIARRCIELAYTVQFLTPHVFLDEQGESLGETNGLQVIPR